MSFRVNFYGKASKQYGTIRPRLLSREYSRIIFCCAVAVPLNTNVSYQNRSVQGKKRLGGLTSFIQSVIFGKPLESPETTKMQNFWCPLDS